VLPASCCTWAGSLRAMISDTESIDQNNAGASAHRWLNNSRTGIGELRDEFRLKFSRFAQHRHDRVFRLAATAPNQPSKLLPEDSKAGVALDERSRTRGAFGFKRSRST
jgi:hypothetical protein